MDKVLRTEMNRFQDEVHEWRKHNFPDSGELDCFEGIVEELGELARARGKARQGIREHAGDDGQLALKEIDAIGDLLIFTLGYCSYQGYDLIACLDRAWDEVKERDWIKYPRTGTEQGDTALNIDDFADSED